MLLGYVDKDKVNSYAVSIAVPLVTLSATSIPNSGVGKLFHPSISLPPHLRLPPFSLHLGTFSFSVDIDSFICMLMEEWAACCGLGDQTVSYLSLGWAS